MVNIIDERDIVQSKEEHTAIETKHNLLHEFVINKCSKSYDDIAIESTSSGTTSLTFDDLVQCILKMSSHLTNQGCSCGDVVAIFSPNIVEFAVVLHGTLCAGCVVLLCPPSLTSEELEFQLSACHVRVVITHSMLLKTCNEALERATNLKIDSIIVCDEKVTDLPSNSFFLRDIIFNSIDGKTSITSYGPGKNRKEDDVAIISFTSGISQNKLSESSGRKVELTHKSLIQNLHLMLNGRDGIFWRPSDVLLSATGELLWLVWMLNAALTCENFGVTVTAIWTPVLKFFTLRKLTAKYNISTLKEIWIPGSQVNPTFSQQVSDEFKVIIRSAYLLTEAGPIAAVTSADMSCIFINSDGNTVPNGEIGEICVKGPQLIESGMGNTLGGCVFDNYGYFHSGDAGYINKYDELILCGRIQDILYINGEIVPAVDIETDIIYSFGNLVTEVAVVQVKSDDSLLKEYQLKDRVGESIIVCLVSLKKKAIASSWTAEDLLHRFKESFSSSLFHIDQVRIESILPSTSGGKLNRSTIRSMMLSNSGGNPESTINDPNSMQQVKSKETILPPATPKETHKSHENLLSITEATTTTTTDLDTTTKASMSKEDTNEIVEKERISHGEGNDDSIEPTLRKSETLSKRHQTVEDDSHTTDLPTTTSGNTELSLELESASISSTNSSTNKPVAISNHVIDNLSVSTKTTSNSIVTTSPTMLTVTSPSTLTPRTQQPVGGTPTRLSAADRLRARLAMKRAGSGGSTPTHSSPRNEPVNNNNNNNNTTVVETPTTKSISPPNAEKINATKDTIEAPLSDKSITVTSRNMSSSVVATVSKISTNDSSVVVTSKKIRKPTIIDNNIPKLKVDIDILKDKMEAIQQQIDSCNDKEKISSSESSKLQEKLTELRNEFELNSESFSKLQSDYKKEKSPQYDTLIQLKSDVKNFETKENTLRNRKVSLLESMKQRRRMIADMKNAIKTIEKQLTAKQQAEEEANIQSATVSTYNSGLKVEIEMLERDQMKKIEDNKKLRGLLSMAEGARERENGQYLLTVQSLIESLSRKERKNEPIKTITNHNPAASNSSLLGKHQRQQNDNSNHNTTRSSSSSRVLTTADPSIERIIMSDIYQLLDENFCLLEDSIELQLLPKLIESVSEELLQYNIDQTLAADQLIIHRNNPNYDSTAPAALKLQNDFRGEKNNECNNSINTTTTSITNDYHSNAPPAAVRTDGIETKQSISKVGSLITRLENENQSLFEENETMFKYIISEFYPQCS